LPKIEIVHGQVTLLGPVSNSDVGVTERIGILKRRKRNQGTWEESNWNIKSFEMKSRT